jgi:hypothetical protein
MSKPSLLAEYETADALVAAARELHERGYTDLDAYSPYPLHDADELLGLAPSKIPWLVLAGGLLGALGGYGFQYFITVIDYYLDIGNRPQHSPLAYIPITFEMGILLAAFAAFGSVFVLCRLPRLWHPVFEVPGFERATIDRFFLEVRGGDPKFDRVRTTGDLEATRPLRVVPVAGEPDSHGRRQGVEP